MGFTGRYVSSHERDRVVCDLVRGMYSFLLWCANPLSFPPFLPPASVTRTLSLDARDRTSV